MSQTKGVELVTYKETLNAKVVGEYSTGVLIPAGRVIKVDAYTGALGSSVTLSVGIVGTPTKFITTADVAAAGVDSMTNTLAGGVYTQLKQPAVLNYTLAGATTASSNQDLVIMVWVANELSA